VVIIRLDHVKNVHKEMVLLGAMEIVYGNLVNVHLMETVVTTATLATMATTETTEMLLIQIIMS
jgi:hypothetical protein